MFLGLSPGLGGSIIPRIITPPSPPPISPLASVLQDGRASIRMPSREPTPGGDSGSSGRLLVTAVTAAW